MSIQTFHTLPETPIGSLEEFVERDGGSGLRRALELDPEAIIDEIELAGVRGRGGAGFPTARKWRGVQSEATADDRITVVVNAAEGASSRQAEQTVTSADAHLLFGSPQLPGKFETL